MTPDEATETDAREAWEELSFIYDQKLSRLLEKTVIDFRDDEWGSGFLITPSLGIPSRLQTRGILAAGEDEQAIHRC